MIAFPEPESLVVEFVGGPHCGDHQTAVVGPRGLTPPVLRGRYHRSDRLLRTGHGALRVAYDWRPLLTTRRDAT